jgi:hypothetical protein
LEYQIPNFPIPVAGVSQPNGNRESNIIIIKIEIKYVFIVTMFTFP